MIISGFLMYYHFVERQDKEPWGSPSTWFKFYIRRWFRIVPLLAAVVGLLLLTPHFWQACHLNSFSDCLLYFLGRITFVFGFSPASSVKSIIPDWSLALEMQFYLLFPFLVLFVRRFGFPFFICICSLIAAISLHLVSYYKGTPPGLWGWYPQPTLLPLKIHIFAVGMVSAGIYFEGARVLRSFWYLPAFLGLAAASPFGYTRLMGVVYALLYLLFLFNFSAARSFFVRINNFFARHPWCYWPAETSYSAYLIHTIFFTFLLSSVYQAMGGTPLSIRGFLPLYLCSLFVINFTGYLLLIAIERPGIECGRRLISRLRSSKPPVTTASTELAK